MEELGGYIPREFMEYESLSEVPKPRFPEVPEPRFPEVPEPDFSEKKTLTEAAIHVKEEATVILTKTGDSKLAKYFAARWKAFWKWLNAPKPLKARELAAEAGKWQNFQYYVHKLVPEQRNTKIAVLLLALAAIIGALITVIKTVQHYHLIPKSIMESKNRKNHKKL